MAVRALRHCPEALGLNLNSAGYCPVRDLAEAFKKRGYDVSVHDIEKLGENERFGFAAEHTLIRADYGSSIGLRLEDMYESGEAPPEYLYHGTSVSAVEPIKELGIIKAPGKNGRRARDHIFLTESEKNRL